MANVRAKEPLNKLDDRLEFVAFILNFDFCRKSRYELLRFWEPLNKSILLVETCQLYQS